MYQVSKQAGFTYIEMLLVMGIIVVIMGVASISVSGLIPKTTSNAAEAGLVADLRQQQIKSMLGDSDGSAHGVHIESNSYTLFTGTTYSAADSSNFVIDVDSNITLSSTFTGNQVAFDSASGAVASYVSGQDQITVTQGITGEVVLITVNSLGVPER